jgi:uncharacterized protein (TIGR02145 family)
VKKSIWQVRVMGIVAAVMGALLLVGCDDSASAKGSGQVDGFLDRVNAKPGSAGGGPGTDNKREVTVSSISSGAVGSGYYVVGTTVLIVAGTVDGGRFDHWTTKSNGVTFSNPNEATTSFIMPENNVTVTAVFTFSVSVSGGGTGMTGEGYYTPGETVSINAGTVTERPFGKWTTESNGVVFADANKAATSFTMPTNSVTVTAGFTYRVTVSAGTGATGGGDYLPGATVTIKAGTNPDGVPFRKWTTSSKVLSFTNASSATTTFTMPSVAVAVIAVFVGTFTDNRDGQKYDMVTIDGTVWMAENLNYPTSSGSWCYNGVPCARYGRLYDWATAKTACPTGWKLPDTADWNRLVKAAGGKSAASNKLKAQSGWFNGTDDYGFVALPGGNRYADGSFHDEGRHGYWWTATEYSSDYACRRYMYYDVDYVYEDNSLKIHGLSVRCIQD